MENKDILSLADEEFEKIIANDPQEALKVRSILSQGINGIQAELDRIQLILSDITQRTSLLLTLAGLFSFLPQVFNFDTEYLKHFLVWTFPFLVFAIIFFYFASIRTNTVITQFPTAAEGTREELITLRIKAIGIQDMWNIFYISYNKTLKYYRYCSSAVYVYLISLVINLYIFTFLTIPDVCFSLSFFILLCGVLYLLVNRTTKNSYSKSFSAKE